jgi:hypothetical protein
MDDRGIMVRFGFLVHKAKVMSLTQSSTRRVPGVKRPEHEAHHLPPTSAKVKNERRYSTSTYSYMACRGKICFTLRKLDCWRTSITMLHAFFWVIPRRLNFICRRFRTLCLFHLHRRIGVEWHLSAYEDGTEYSETSAYKIQAAGNYPEENIQHAEHGESLKSRIHNDDNRSAVISPLQLDPCAGDCRDVGWLSAIGGNKA